MSLYGATSRYRSAEQYTAVDGRGREVRLVAPPPPPAETALGIHLRIEGQRLDHLAAKYLSDPAGFWRLCELNGAMWPDALAETREIEIPLR